MVHQKNFFETVLQGSSKVTNIWFFMMVLLFDVPFVLTNRLPFLHYFIFCYDHVPLHWQQWESSRHLICLKHIVARTFFYILIGSCQYRNRTLQLSIQMNKSEHVNHTNLRNFLCSSLHGALITFLVLLTNSFHSQISRPYFQINLTNFFYIKCF